jgi:hypothetical protein
LIGENGDPWKQLYLTMTGAFGAAYPVMGRIAAMSDIMIGFENFNNNYEAVIKC